MEKLPILYSFRRCPYAMRARMAIAYAEVETGLREVVLKDKPAAMLLVSPKATVPVIVETSGNIIEESRDVMAWALERNDRDNWLGELGLRDPLIDACDEDFKHWLDRYKYAVRFPEKTEDWYRNKACDFVETLETRLKRTGFLRGDALTVTDVAIFPFIRQFARVDEGWWATNPYPKVSAWLNSLVSSPLFQQVMKKYPQWREGDPDVKFPG